MKELEEKYLSHSETFGVALDEIDFTERLKPSAVLQYFQNLATVHADILGIGFSEMLEKNMIWVLTRLSVKYYRSPEVGEKIRVVTFPRKPATAYALRDFYVYDEDEKLIVSGASKWLVIDINNHLIRRCSVLFDYPDDAYMPDEPFEEANKTLSDAKDGQMKHIMSDIVHVSDLDRNGHMNNARYGDIILNAFDVERYKTHAIDRFDLNFISEMKFGKKYDVYKCDEGDISQIRAESDGAVTFRAEVCWSKK